MRLFVMYIKQHFVEWLYICFSWWPQ